MTGFTFCHFIRHQRSLSRCRHIGNCADNGKKKGKSEGKERKGSYKLQVLKHIKNWFKVQLLISAGAFGSFTDAFMLDKWDMMANEMDLESFE